MPITPAADATADAGVDSLGEGPECVLPRDCSTVDTTMALLAVPWAICTAGLLAVVLYVNVHIFSIHAAVSAAVTSENSAVADSAAPPSSSLLLPSTRDRDRARYTVLSLSIAAVLAHVVLSYLFFRRAYYLLLDVSLSLLDLSAMVEMVRKMHCAAFFFVDSVERACAMEPCRTFWVKTFSPCAEVSAAESALNTLSLQQLKLDARLTAAAAAAAADAAAHVVEEVDGGSRSSDTLTASTITASTDVTSSSSSRPPTAFARSEEQERQWQPRGTMATDATAPPPPPPLPAAAAAAAATASVAEAEDGARRCSGTAGSPDRQLLPQPPQEEAEEDGSIASLMNVSRRHRLPFSLEVRRRHVALLQISFLTYGELVQGHSLALPQLATRFISAVLLAARRFEAHVVDLREDGATLAWNAFSVSRGDYMATCAQCGHWLSGSYFRPMSADSEARFAVAGFAGFAVCGTTSERGGHVLHGQPVTVMRELPALLERRYCPFVWLATASSAAAAVGGATPPALRDGPAWVRWGTVKAGDGHSFGLFALDDGDGDDLGVLRRGGGGEQPWVWHAPEWKMFGDEADLELPSDPSLAVALRDGAGGLADPHDLRSPPPLPTTATADTAAAASQALLSEEPVVGAALPAAEQPVPRRAASASEAAPAPAPSPAPSLPPVETFHDSKGKLYQLSHNILGESKACVVRLALSDSGTLVAVKEIKIQRGDVSSMRQRRCRREKRILVSAGDPSPLLGEVRIMERLYHTCIVGYIACQESATALRIIMEYVGGGTLLQFASVAGEKGRRSTAVRFPVAVLLRSVLEGIAFLHRHGILHGDIKPQNVLVPDSGPCKIADFGISRRLANPAAPSVEGTPFYMAPEVTRGAASMASDVWSFGILFAEVLTGRLPYDPDISDTYLVTQFMFGRDVERRTCVPLESDANDVFLSCTHYDAAQRKTAAELLCMPYFSLEGSEGYG